MLLLAVLAQLVLPLAAREGTGPPAVLPDFAAFDHAATGFALTRVHLAADCADCHDTGAVPGRPANHPGTTNDSAACHGTGSWTRITLDHDQVTGTCVNRHVAGKPGGHFQTALDCDSCHPTST